MAKTVAQMTTDELRDMIGELIEGKLLELFRDPDVGLELSETFRDRLEQQQREVAAGERGQSLDEVVQKLGLA